MIVRCINDDFSQAKWVFQDILKVGDDDLLPKKDGIYEVIGYGFFDDELGGQFKAYKLLGL